MRLLRTCRPLMEKYGAKEAMIQQLNQKHKQLDERDISFEKYREQKDQLKMQEALIKRDENSVQQNMREMLNADSGADH